MAILRTHCPRGSSSGALPPGGVVSIGRARSSQCGVMCRQHLCDVATGAVGFSGASLSLMIYGVVWACWM